MNEAMTPQLRTVNPHRLYVQKVAWDGALLRAGEVGRVLDTCEVRTEVLTNSLSPRIV